MSVAFRRESDEEHLEPRFEMPIPPGPNLVTPRGLALIEARVALLETEASGETARELRYWRRRLASAAVVHPRESDEAIFGSRLTVRLNGELRRFTIVGQDEAAGAADMLAHDAPLARALLGAGAGDLVDFAGRAEAIEVLEVATG